MMKQVDIDNAVEDWFNTYLGYLQYVSRCTNVWFMFMIVDVTIDVILPSNWMCAIQWLRCGAGIAERVSAMDWLSLRYAAIITLPVSNPGLCS